MRNRRFQAGLASVVLCSALWLTASPSSSLVAGARDPGFGEGGVATIQEPGLQSSGRTAVDPVGRVLVGGGNEFGDGVVARLQSSGAVDLSFGTRGMAVVPDPVEALFATPDGAVLAVGSNRDDPAAASPAVRVARLTPSGERDLGYGEGGLATTEGRMRGVAVLDDGGLAISLDAGDAGDTGRIAVFDATGDSDTEFGGRRSYPFPTGGLDADDSGRIYVVGGSAHDRGLGDWVRRITRAGVLDQSFGNGGVATLPGSGDLVPHLRAVDATGTGLAVAGDVFTRSGDPTFFVGAGRFDLGGRTVTSFGAGGFAFAQAYLQHAVPESGVHVVFDARSRVLVTEGSGSILRFTPSGVPDPSFDFEGRMPGFRELPWATDTPAGLLVPLWASTGDNSLDLGLVRLLHEPAGSSARIAGNDPVGSLDGAAGGASSIVIRGWTIDPDTARDIAAVVLIDGGLGAVELAAHPRADLAAVFPAYGARHGYHWTIPAGSGRHTVCVYGRNEELGFQNTTLGCRTVSVGGSGDPFGAFDEAARSGDRVMVRGWAIDPDVAEPTDVHVYVDGRHVSTALASSDRPDVDRVYPAYGPQHGWRAEMTVAPGAHTVCVYAINRAAGVHNTTLGCKPI